MAIGSEVRARLVPRVTSIARVRGQSKTVTSMKDQLKMILLVLMHSVIIIYRQVK